LALAPRIEAVLQQERTEVTSMDDSFRRLREALNHG